MFRVNHGKVILPDNLPQLIYFDTNDDNCDQHNYKKNQTEELAGHLIVNGSKTNSPSCGIPGSINDYCTS